MPGSQPEPPPASPSRRSGKGRNRRGPIIPGVRGLTELVEEALVDVDYRPGLHAQLETFHEFDKVFAVYEFVGPVIAPRKSRIALEPTLRRSAGGREPDPHPCTSPSEGSGVPGGGYLVRVAAAADITIGPRITRMMNQKKARVRVLAQKGRRAVASATAIIR